MKCQEGRRSGTRPSANAIVQHIPKRSVWTRQGSGHLVERPGPLARPRCPVERLYEQRIGDLVDRTGLRWPLRRNLGRRQGEPRPVVPRLVDKASTCSSNLSLASLSASSVNSSVTAELIPAVLRLETPTRTIASKSGTGLVRQSPMLATRAGWVARRHAVAKACGKRRVEPLVPAGYVCTRGSCDLFRHDHP
jgi:hypothetical protein